MFKVGNKFILKFDVDKYKKGEVFTIEDIDECGYWMESEEHSFITDRHNILGCFTKLD